MRSQAEGWQFVPAKRQTKPGAVLSGLAAVALLAIPGLSSAAAGSAPQARAQSAGAAAKPGSRVVHVNLVGKVDATSGRPGTFTGRPGWPALAPSNVHVPSGATVVLTIREYDDMVTPLRSMGMMGASPFNRVRGGSETVNGKPVTYVSNAHIAHTFTVPALRVNVPLPRAPLGGFTKVVFTFHAPRTPGSYTWLCETPCGSGPMGTGGAMATYGWMRGRFTVG